MTPMWLHRKAIDVAARCEDLHQRGRESGLQDIALERVQDAIAAALHEARAQALDDAIACVPGGNICDPQDVADAIRALKGTDHG